MEAGAVQYMDRDVFRGIKALVYAQCGIALHDGKEAMVQARLGRRMRALGFSNHRQYLRLLKQDQSGTEVRHLLDAISTNVTTFYREHEHFDFLEHAVSAWLGEGRRRFQLWSAACSSGEEAYTMAMSALEAARGRSMDLRILATDISTRVLERARAGHYGPAQMEEVPKALRLRYFSREGRGLDALWTVHTELRRRLCFARLNLAATPYPMRGPFDAIFARNVMIYFDQDGRRRLLREAKRLLRPDGYLFVGHAESLTGMLGEFTPVAPSIYTPLH